MSDRTEYKIGYSDVIRVAVCDDDGPSAEIMLSAIGAAFAKRGVRLETELFTSADALRSGMKRRAFDLLFLDIEMPGTDGISFGEQLRRENDDTEIVYVSGREDRVFDTFKVRPFDFIRKSHFIGDLAKVTDAYLAMLSRGKNDVLTVHGKDGFMNIPVLKIVCFEGRGKMQSIRVDGMKNEVIIYSSMERLSEEFGKRGFLRIHKGLLVNYRYIARFTASEAELTDGTRLPISRRKSAEMRAAYLDLLKQSNGHILV